MGRQLTFSQPVRSLWLFYRLGRQQTKQTKSHPRPNFNRRLLTSALVTDVGYDKYQHLVLAKTRHDLINFKGGVKGVEQVLDKAASDIIENVKSTRDEKTVDQLGPKPETVKWLDYITSGLDVSRHHPMFWKILMKLVSNFGKTIRFKLRTAARINGEGTILLPNMNLLYLHPLVKIQGLL